MTSRAVVIVSGVLSHSPFTTPDAACATGHAAGNSDTFLRQYLLDAGLDVYTAPQRMGDGQVVELDDPFMGPFGSCPAPLPAEMTVDTTADIVLSGPRLLRFVEYLRDRFGVIEIDLIGHSMGGLLARTLIGEIARADHPVRVRTLTTVGSPWEPPMIVRQTDPDVPESACDGLEACEVFVREVFAARPQIDALIDRARHGYDEWADSLLGTLDDIPVTLVAGHHFTKENGDPDRWPNDGVIQLSASTAANVDERHLPDRRVHALPLTHSLFVSETVGLGPETALNWTPEVGRIIADFIGSVG